MTWFDPTGRSTYGIGICDRCKLKFSIEDLHPDRNSPGLRVCDECNDEYDPYRLPARQTEDISLRFTRPDESLSSLSAQGIAEEDRSPPVFLSGSFTLTEASLSWTVPIDPPQEYRIYRSVDGGAFVLIATLPPNDRDFLDSVDLLLHEYDYYVTYLDSLLVESQPSNIVESVVLQVFLIICDNDGTSISSVDGGVTWVQGGSFAPSTTTEQGLAYSPALSRWVSCGSGGASRTGRSENDGAAWTMYDNGMGVSYERATFQFNKFFLGSNNGQVDQSSTGLAGSWSTAFSGQRSYGFAYSSSENRLASCGNTLLDNTIPAIKLTVDGSIWTNGSVTGLPSGGTNANTLYAIGRDDTRGFWYCVNGAGQVFRTADIVAGAWSAIGTVDSNSPPGSGFHAIAFKPGGNGQPIVVVTGVGGVWVSNNDGASFSEFLPADTFRDVFWGEFPSKFVLVGSLKVYLSDNPTATSWVQQTTPGGLSYGAGGKRNV